jgi:hypothetical protein
VLSTTPEPSTTYVTPAALTATSSGPVKAPATVPAPLNEPMKAPSEVYRLTRRFPASATSRSCDTGSIASALAKLPIWPAPVPCPGLTNVKSSV